MCEYLTRGLDSVQRDPTSTSIIAGDFNQMKLNTLWRRFILKRLSRLHKASECSGPNFSQMSELYNDVQHLSRISRSDHQCLLIVLKATEKAKPISKKTRQMKDVNLVRLSLQ
jgi:hypothetical protein